MRKIKRVLDLHARGLSQRAIAGSCGIAQSTVSEYLAAAAAAGLTWPDVGEWNEAEIERKLYPHKPAPEFWRKHREPDWLTIQGELQRHKDLTLRLIWEEYRINHGEGYGYSRFCELYRVWLKKLDLVLRQEHRAGEKMFVDYAGATIPIHTATGEVAFAAAIFVAVLGASSYTFTEATAGQDLASWIGSHQRAFEFFGGVPELVVPDNLKSGVTKPSYYEPQLNRTYEELGEHYGTAILPARPRRARDKAKVEAGVQVVQRWIVMALRHRRFYSLGELNEAIAQLLGKLNQRPFRRRPGARAALFEQLDRPALRPLPAERYEVGEWETARVNLDYHVEANHRHFYSVPSALVHQQVELRSTATTVEIFRRGVRVASHVRSGQKGAATTLPEHRPKAHQKYLDRTPSRLIEEARGTGPATAALVEAALAAKRHPEQGYRACLGILRLCGDYPAARMEAACERALRVRAFSYQSLESILRNKLDQLPLPPKNPAAPPPVLPHDNIRGADYYDPPPGA